MKCRGCEYYVISKCFGNYCRCNESIKPCVAKHKAKKKKKRKQQYVNYGKDNRTIRGRIL